MSISAVNAFYQGMGAQGGGASSVAVYPQFTGEILANYMSGPAAQDLEGFCLPILDGSSTTFTLNWIDGTQTLPYPPSGVFSYRTDPPAWTASTVYPLNAIVLGSGHVQQATTAGKTGTSAPTWSTSGGTVSDGTGAQAVVWTDLGAIALSTIASISFTAITNIHATVTISAAGTSTQIPVINFRLVR
jgi:hypothetical protein